MGNNNRLQTEKLHKHGAADQKLGQIMSRNWELTRDSVVHHYKTQVDTSQDLQTQSNLTKFRSCLRQVAMKTPLQPWICFLDTCSPTQQRFTMLKHLSEWTSTLWLSLPTCRRKSFRHGISFCISSEQREQRRSWWFRNHNAACYNKARTDNWNAWKKACLTRRSTKNLRGWTKVNVAQVCQYYSPKLQHVLQYKHWVQT